MQTTSEPAVARVTPAEPRRAGDYHLIRRIGSGAMGEVWFARHDKTQGLAAVKLIRQTPSRTSERMARFFAREQRAVARLTHPHVVQLFEIGADYLAMRFIDGSNLERRMRTPLAPREALDITLQIADALSHAHGRNVVHRDVKPSNILLDSIGNAYLADFGLAAILDDDDQDDRGGTPQYMAPEQARAQPAGPAADQFSLGRVLAELLAGGRVATDPDEAVRAIPAAIPRELVAVVRRAIDPDPGARWPSVSSFAAALGGVDVADASAATVKLLPEVRVKAPFAWAAIAERKALLAPTIARVDYRLSELVTSGALDAAAVARFRERTGYADFGWCAIAREDRLGPLVEPAAYARTAEIVVMIHGGFSTRETWVDVATHVAQTAAHTVVLVPDVGGYGVSTYAERTPRREHVTAEATLDAVLAWLELLGVRELPTVLAGHSLGAVAVMSAADSLLGPRTSRIAISPVFPSVDAGHRWGLRIVPRAMSGIAKLPGAKRLLGRVMLAWSPMARAYAERERELMFEAFMGLEPATLARGADAYSNAQTAPHEQLQRCIVVLSERDPIAPIERSRRALAKVGFPAANVFTMVADGHLPHGEAAVHPEWTRRNIAELVGLIDQLLVSAREGTVLPTCVASTMITATST